MSIAASVVINPSRQLRLLLAVCGLLIAGVAIRLALIELATTAVLARLGLSLLLVFCGLGLIYSAFTARKSFQLDISGIGEIRLREHYAGAVAKRRKSSPDAKGNGEMVQLMDDSTIWPALLVLRLRRADATRTSLIVLPDMVEPDAFRTLLVAVRWIAAHNGADH